MAMSAQARANISKGIKRAHARRKAEASKAVQAFPLDHPVFERDTKVKILNDPNIEKGLTAAQVAAFRILREILLK